MMESREQHVLAIQVLRDLFDVPLDLGSLVPDESPVSSRGIVFGYVRDLEQLLPS